MIRRILTFILLNSFLISGDSSIKNLVIGFWPEYDHPGVFPNQYMKMGVLVLNQITN